MGRGRTVEVKIEAGDERGTFYMLVPQGHDAIVQDIMDVAGKNVARCGSVLRRTGNEFDTITVRRGDINGVKRAVRGLGITLSV